MKTIDIHELAALLEKADAVMLCPDNGDDVLMNYFNVEPDDRMDEDLAEDEEQPEQLVIGAENWDDLYLTDDQMVEVQDDGSIRFAGFFGKLVLLQKMMP